MQTCIVDVNGSGDFTTIQEAVDALPEKRSEPVTIAIQPGVYKEKLVMGDICHYQQSRAALF